MLRRARRQMVVSTRVRRSKGADILRALGCAAEDSAAVYGDG